MKIAMIASEIAPFAKTGGLADVVGTLAIALERYGHELCLIMPAYRSALQGQFALEETPIKLSVPVSTEQQTASVFKAAMGKNIAVYLVRADRYFDRDALYGTAEGDFVDNAERFTFLSRAALEILRDQPIDLVHCHDWQAALTIVFLKTQSDRYPSLAAAKTVLTLHNLGFQGIFAAPHWHLLNLDRSLFTPRYLEFYGQINFLKGALTFADKITTVSPSYAQEIMTKDQGFGLEGVLRQRARDLTGILNGVDYSQWSPATDPHIAQRYSENNLAVKQSCKKSLQGRVNLPAKSELPLIGIISRLTAQKGFDLIEKIFDRLMEQEIQLVLLGSGESRYEEYFRLAASRFPDKVAVRIGFDEVLAHQIEAGADLFLMPSLYEPCGLNQMFSLRYGTIPIVRAVGGLKDTVAPIDPVKSGGTGFVFGPYEPAALWETIEAALRFYQDKTAWSDVQRRAMRMDFSWDRSAQAFSHLYGQLLG